MPQTKVALPFPCASYSAPDTAGGGMDQVSIITAMAMIMAAGISASVIAVFK
ncbi:hypothetical protein V9K67_15545 [Paraflavisolibacter sp. H34]|uniref:hypothetical protein n=1 Tax=Huijunlia imazamoxiresistens TaxID=3127457 RepID=UPI00301642D4